MSARRIVIGYVAGAVTGAAVAMLALRLASPTDAAPTAAADPPRTTAFMPRPEASDAPARPQTRRAPAARPDPRPAASASPAEPLPDPAWTALVEGMLEQEVEYRFGRKLRPESKARLLGELARLRDVSLAMQQAPATPTDPAALRDRLNRRIALLEVDRAFREELGIGIAELVHDPGMVDEVDAPPDVR